MVSKIGERRIMNCGEECEIVEYNGVRNITVKFLKTGELVKNCQYISFKREAIKSHFTPTVYGVGIVGLEDTNDKEGEMIKSYYTWNNMLKRCYHSEFQEKRPTYKGCAVCDEWLYYPNFKKWFDKNYYEIGSETMCLDKDILNKHNKVYSPDTCMFVPQNINTLFTKRQNDRGDLPIGVSLSGKTDKYRVRCNIFDIKIKKYEGKYLGTFNNSKEAFNTYKKAKENNIKLVADYYKDQIPSKLYDAMYRYEVETTD